MREPRANPASIVEGRVACCLALALALSLGGCSAPARGPLRCQPMGEPAPPPVSGLQPIWATNSDGTTTSAWQLVLAGQGARLIVDDTSGAFAGTLTSDDGSVDTVDNFTWSDASGALQFRDVGDGYWRWIVARAMDGVLVGRASYSTVSADRPTGATAFGDHVTGWSEQYFSQDIVPRTFSFVAGGLHARLRLDRDPNTGVLSARYKQIASDAKGDLDEQIELDGDVQAWDGRTLAVSFLDGGTRRTITADVDGATITGTLSARDGSPAASFVGARSELLGFGFAVHDRATRAGWQARTRRQLMHLMMADNPAPASVRARRWPATLIPTGDTYAVNRDDSPHQHPIRYTVDELLLSYTLPDPYGGAPLSRRLHGFVATPTTPAPPCGRPVVIALNGHDGSAANTLDPTATAYWYGDAWARRGFVVVAIDVGHRPLADRQLLYDDYVDGDAPDEGNGLHPAIKSAGLDSDWEEDGERTWDVARAIDFAATLPDTDGSRVIVTGLSMGGEVATWAGALDPRVTLTIAAGFIPDFSVLEWRANHACWQWQHGSPHDYIDTADLHALMAPRPLVVQSGVLDDFFSDLQPPFIDGKEVTRRSRSAYADAPDNFIFYLHDDGHAYHFGDVPADDSTAPAEGLMQPLVIAPLGPGNITWASDTTRELLGKTLVQQVRASYAALREAGRDADQSAGDRLRSLLGDNGDVLP